MHQKSIKTLEYPDVLAQLADETAFSASRALALALAPDNTIHEVRQRLAFTTEARRLIETRPDAGIRGARDIRQHVTAAERGATLTPPELLEVLATLRASDQVSRMIMRLDESFPLLRSLAQDLPLRAGLESHLETSISEVGEVLDTASPELRRIRLDIGSARHRLQERLSTLVSEYRSALQEPIITMRSDRYVLPVRAEARGQVRGIVHDQSSSGATVFIEPLVIVELNNRLRQLEMDEREEVERILHMLSGEVAADAAYLRLAVELLAEIDLHLAKARYAGRLRANEPRINDSGYLHLREARHPLLKGHVVPIDFELGRDYTMVVITGPNTGGKTVALRTVGLFALMAQAGMHVPAREDTDLPIFANVFADIGDEQSIEQSLSTFSSHLSRIVEILGEAGPGSLILLDEVGAGTDPAEGSALARAILSYLLEHKIATVATTHYSELKAFAHDEPGAVNASVEFDPETLSPTYRVIIGLPGRSNALAIAARLGLAESIITAARSYLGAEGVRMEEMLQEIQQEHRVAADERYRLSMERAEAEYQRRELEREREAINEERERIINEARAQARRELESVQSEIARIRAAAARQRLDQAQLAALRERTRALESRTAPLPARRRTSERPQEVVEPGELQVGDLVRIRSMDQRGELVALQDGQAEVRLGPLKMRVPVEEIERLSKRQTRGEHEPPALTLPPREAVQAPSIDLDMRGWRVEDALPALDAYLNDAYMAGMPFVRIIHGKGTGVLRQAVRQHLTGHPLVRAFASAEAREGGDGVTVATLNS